MALALVGKHPAAVTARGGQELCVHGHRRRGGDGVELRLQQVCVHTEISIRRQHVGIGRGGQNPAFVRRIGPGAVDVFEILLFLIGWAADGVRRDSFGWRRRLEGGRNAVVYHHGRRGGRSLWRPATGGNDLAGRTKRQQNPQTRGPKDRRSAVGGKRRQPDARGKNGVDDFHGVEI